MPLTNFPTQVDTFPVYVDVSPADMVDIEAWKALRALTNRTTQQEQDYLALSAELATKMVNAQTINKIHDAIVAIESSFDTSVGSYLQSNTDAINSEIAKFTYRNAWSNITSYAVKNTVSRNGNSYICKTANTGIDPATDATSTYWGKIAEKGDKGDKGDPGLGLIPKGAYSAATAYIAGDAVYSGKSVWYAKTSSTGQPLTVGTYWGIFMTVDDVIRFSNIAVLTSAWVSDTTYALYKYRAAITLSGVINSMIIKVIFDYTDAMSGNYSVFVNSYNGGVYIYAKEIPSGTITIPTIECTRVV